MRYVRAKISLSLKIGSSPGGPTNAKQKARLSGLFAISAFAAYRLFEMLSMMPRLTVERVKTALGTTFPPANAAVKTLEELGLITETTGKKKNRSFSYDRYIKLLSA